VCAVIASGRTAAIPHKKIFIAIWGWFKTHKAYKVKNTPTPTPKARSIITARGRHPLII
jgi:hypothetical protein